MLGSRNQHTFPHQAGRVAHTGDIADMRLDLKAIEIGAAEDDSGVGWCWNQTDAGGNGSVQTDPFDLNRMVDCELMEH